MGIQGIQAVVKIKLKDEKFLYGFVEICSGGYEFRYKSHGFCQQYEDGNWHVILYDLYFGGFHVAEYGTFRPGKKIYFMKNVSLDSWNREVIYDEKKKTIEIQHPANDKFELKDHITLYQDIPPDEWIGYSDSEGIQQITVKMEDIYSLKLVQEPAIEWLKKIDKARSIRNKRTEEEAQDAVYPNWYHEIVKDEKTLLYFQKYFRATH